MERAQHGQVSIETEAQGCELWMLFVVCYFAALQFIDLFVEQDLGLLLLK